jgi:hypothetical protein
MAVFDQQVRRYLGRSRDPDFTIALAYYRTGWRVGLQTEDSCLKGRLHLEEDCYEIIAEIDSATQATVVPISPDAGELLPDSKLRLWSILLYLAELTEEQPD